jgi:hypothetical protein
MSETILDDGDVLVSAEVENADEGVFVAIWHPYILRSLPWMPQNGCSRCGLARAVAQVPTGFREVESTILVRQPCVGMRASAACTGSAAACFSGRAVRSRIAIYSVLWYQLVTVQVLLERPRTPTVTHTGAHSFWDMDGTDGSSKGFSMCTGTSCHWGKRLRTMAQWLENKLVQASAADATEPFVY